MLALQTPYFLVTDTDTFFLRSFEALDLMYQQEGCAKTSGVCDLQKQVRLCGGLSVPKHSGSMPGCCSPKH